MSQSVAEWRRVAQSGAEWRRVAQSGAECHRDRKFSISATLYVTLQLTGNQALEFMSI